MTTPEKRGRRTPTAETGTVRIGFFKSVPCTIRDISPGGARIVPADDVELPEEFKLRCALFKRSRPCLRRWVSGSETGIEFI